MCPALDCIFGGGMCRGLKYTTAAFVSQRNKSQDKNKNTPHDSQGDRRENQVFNCSCL